MADTTYAPKVYRKQGGDVLVVADGGEITHEGQAAVTQITSISTAVTLNKLSGVITTVAAVTAAAGEEAFTVNNSRVAATDMVVACIKSYGGAGTPQVWADTPAAGTFKINITNLHATLALNAALVINFFVIKATV